MAWVEITEPKDTARTWAADSDSDKTEIETAYPDAPIGSIIIAGNSGEPKIYFKFPAGFAALN